MQTLKLIKQTVPFSLISITVLFTPLTTQALTVEEVTNPRQNNHGWVTDMADILSDQTETKLNQIINNLEQTNGTEIAVVTVSETAPATSPKAFATRLFNHWGIGKAEVNNGVLLLISKGDRRVEIETGYGIASILPNAKVKNIIDHKITPQYKQGNYDRGTLDGTQALIVALNSPVAEIPVSSPVTEIPVSSPVTEIPVSSPVSEIPVSSPVSEIPATSLVTTILNYKEEYLWEILSTIGLVSAVGGVFWYTHRKIFVDPQTHIFSLNRYDSHNIHCANCKQRMETVAAIKLTKAQQVAQQIGAVSYEGYKCPTCSQVTQPYLIIAYTSYSSRYQNCSKCRELTITHTKKTLRSATQYREGKLLITDQCHCCDYIKETTKKIPRLPPPSDDNDSSGSSSSDSGSSGSSGSGGSFGGGSSGGGGAGGSW